MRKYLQHRGVKGFTLIELMVSLVILSMLSLFGGRIYLNYTNASRDLKATNLINEEARFLMERIVKEIRQNSIDYEEYFNHNVVIPSGVAGGYGGNYCAYSAFFYDDNGESIGTRNFTQEFTTYAAISDTSAIHQIEHELYLINISGNTRTFIKRIVRDVNGDDIGKISMVKMIGKDFGEDGINSQDSTNGLLPGHNISCDSDALQDYRERDGKIDTWHCDPDYPCKEDEDITSVLDSACDGYTHLVVDDPTSDDYSFIDISPNAINIIDLKFMIAPADDPWKAYNMKEIQMQPHITIQMTAEANPKLLDTTNKDRPPSITLTTTITSRNYDEINSDCH